LNGKLALIASGSVWEEIDPVRVLTTKASGKTGLELAKQAYRLGAKVKLVHSRPAGLSGIEEVVARTGKEMHDSVLEELGKEKADFFLIPAAVSDFKVKKSRDKISSRESVKLELEPAKKLVEEVRQGFQSLFIVGFKAETNVSDAELVQRAKEKMERDKMQLMAANDVASQGIGQDTNSVVILSKHGQRKVSGRKRLVAEAIWEEAIKASQQ